MPFPPETDVDAHVVAVDIAQFSRSVAADDELTLTEERRVLLDTIEATALFSRTKNGTSCCHFVGDELRVAFPAGEIGKERAIEMLEGVQERLRADGLVARAALASGTCRKRDLSFKTGSFWYLEGNAVTRLETLLAGVPGGSIAIEEKRDRYTCEQLSDGTERWVLTAGAPVQPAPPGPPSRRADGFSHIVVAAACSGEVLRDVVNATLTENDLLGIGTGRAMIALRADSAERVRPVVAALRQRGSFPIAVTKSNCWPVSRDWLPKSCFEGKAAVTASRFLAKLHPGQVALDAGVHALWPVKSEFVETTLRGKLHDGDLTAFVSVAADGREERRPTKGSSAETASTNDNLQHRPVSPPPTNVESDGSRAAPDRDPPLQGSALIRGKRARVLLGALLMVLAIPLASGLLPRTYRCALALDSDAACGRVVVAASFDRRESDSVPFQRVGQRYFCSISGTSVGLTNDFVLLLWARTMAPGATRFGDWHLQHSGSGAVDQHDGSWSGTAQLGNELDAPQENEPFELAISVVEAGEGNRLLDQEHDVSRPIPVGFHVEYAPHLRAHIAGMRPEVPPTVVEASVPQPRTSEPSVIDPQVFTSAILTAIEERRFREAVAQLDELKATHYENLDEECDRVYESCRKFCSPEERQAIEEEINHRCAKLQPHGEPAPRFSKRRDRPDPHAAVTP